jgi:hypothetical protein
MHGSGSFPQIKLCYFDDTLPVEVSSIDVTVEDGTAFLEWATNSETDNAGFAVEMATGNAPFEEIGWVEGSNATTGSRYSFVTSSLSPGDNRFRLRQIDFDGTVTLSSVIEARVEVPGQFVLEQAYPNPFNPTTTIRFALRESAPVQVSLHSPLGQQIDLLYQGMPPAGESIPVRIDASGYPSGVYLVRLVGNGIMASQAITLSK